MARVRLVCKEAAIPRNGQGQLSLPANTAAEPGEDITSAQVNSRFDDLVTDANTARPVSAGGTGGTSQATAATSLGYAIAQTSTSDDTAGRGLIVGGFGIGGVGLLTPDDDCDAAVGATAVYSTTGGVTANTPVDFSGVLFNICRGSDRDTQIWTRHSSADQFIRQRTDADTFTDWQQNRSIVAIGGTSLDGWIKYSDQRMEAWLTETLSYPISTAFQGGYRGTTKTWTFLVPFATTPTVTATTVNFSAFGVILGDVSLTAAQYAVVAPAQVSSAARTVSLYATGRY